MENTKIYAFREIKKEVMEFKEMCGNPLYCNHAVGGFAIAERISEGFRQKIEVLSYQMILLRMSNHLEIGDSLLTKSE